MNRPVRSLILIMGMSVALLQTGCKDGPMPEYLHLNPWLRREWEADEQYAVTFHKRLKELEAIRGQVANLPVGEQQRLTREIAQAIHEEESAAMRWELVRTLGEIPTAAAQTELEQACLDEDSDVRAEACRGLGQRGNPVAVATLGRVLTEDKDVDVRIAACRQLGAIRTPESEQLLRKMVDEGEPAMQRAAAVALRTAGFAVPVPSKPGESTHLAKERNWAMPFTSLGNKPKGDQAPVDSSDVASTPGSTTLR